MPFAYSHSIVHAVGRPILTLLGAVAVAIASAASVRAEISANPAPTPRPEPAARDALYFQDASLAPGFVPDPQYLRGVAGGTQSAIEIAGIDSTSTGRCTGVLNDLPNHRIYLEAAFESLRLRLQSEGDTTLVVRGPGGTWCNDDYDERNAGIAGQWLPGAYEIWVGSYEADRFFPYDLEFSEVVFPSSHRDRDAIFRR